MYKNYFRGVTAVVLLLLITACSIAPVSQQVPNQKAWLARQAVLSKLDHWKMNGRLAIAAKEDSGSATIIWEQRQKNFSIRITAPMGQGVIILEGDEQSVQMRDGQGHIMTAESAEELLWENTGWEIPLRGLRLWVLGLNTIDSNELQLDDAGHIINLKAAGWDIHYLKYTQKTHHNKPLSLPSKMELQNENLKIKLSINTWQVF